MFARVPSFKPNIVIETGTGRWSIKCYGGYQSRNYATIHMLIEAFKGLDTSLLERKRKIFVCTDDKLETVASDETWLSYSCRSHDNKNILLIPDFIFWYWPEVGVPDYRELTTAMVEAGSEKPHSDEVFWIGNPLVHASRQKLLELGRIIPGTKFVDITWEPQSQHENLPSERAMKTRDNRFVSLPDHCGYRYLIDVEGRGYSGRLKVLLFSNRPVFLQERPWGEYFFSELKPFYHYIPIASSLDNLEEMISWARCHERECEEIAANALAFAKANLTREAAINTLRRTLVSAFSQQRCANFEKPLSGRITLKMVHSEENAFALLPISPLPPAQERPIFSVMIPTYNCAKLLGKTLESVLAQDLGPDQMQITVVDDHSTSDDPESVVNSIGRGRVEFFRQPHNVGATKNFNTCIELSRGQFVHILHGDDWLENSFYESINALIARFPEASLFSARFYYVDENGVRTGISPRVQQYELAVSKDSTFFTDGPIIHFVTSVFRRSFFEQNGSFNDYLVHAADWEMWVRVIKEGGIVMTPDVLGNYRVFANNDTGRLMRTAENLVDRQRCIKMLAARYPDFDVVRAYLSTLVMCENQENRFKQIGDMDSARNNRMFWNKNSTLTVKLGRLMREFTDYLRSTTIVKHLMIK